MSDPNDYQTSPGTRIDLPQLILSRLDSLDRKLERTDKLVQEIHESRVKGARESGSFEARLESIEDTQKTYRNWIGGLTVGLATMFFGWLVKK